MDNAQLQKRIEALEKEIASLKASATIPYPIESAFIGRGFMNSKIREVPLTFAIAGMGMIREIGLTGDPETISVLDYPTTFLKLDGVTDSGAPIYIPAYVT